MSRNFKLPTVIITVSFSLVLCGWSHDTFAQVSAQELDSKVAHTLDALHTEIQQVDQGVATAGWFTLAPQWQRIETAQVDEGDWVMAASEWQQAETARDDEGDWVIEWQRAETARDDEGDWVIEWQRAETARDDEGDWVIEWQRAETARDERAECCPACCDGPKGCDGCEGVCPATQKFSDGVCPFAARDALQPPSGFIQNQYAESASKQLCEDLAETMSECLSDSQIPLESRRRILASTMKLLVRNAELESQAEVARLQLEHERELAATRENLIQLQARMSAVGEVKNWMGPLYTNLNQTQQSMNNVMTNLQLVNRTLRLLENEKNVTKRRQANQPLPAQLVPRTQQAPRPERWSQLPNHAEPSRKTETQDHTTQQSTDGRNETFLSRSSQVAPPRLSDQEVQRQQLESRMRQLQVELDRLNSQNIRTVGWESESIQQIPNTLRNPNQLRPMPQQLRPHPQQQLQPHPQQQLQPHPQQQLQPQLQQQSHPLQPLRGNR